MAGKSTKWFRSDMILEGIIWFLFNSNLNIGFIDKIEGRIALVEYKFKDDYQHKKVYINPNNCIPKEGGMVLFNNIEVVSCFKKGAENEQ